MMSCRIGSIELPVELMRNPGQWMPLTGPVDFKRPEKSLQRQSALNIRVLIDMSVIVEIDELIAQSSPIQSKRQHRQQYRPKDLW